MSAPVISAFRKVAPLKVAIKIAPENFAFFKDRFGHWVYGADSVEEFLEREKVPKDQKKEK